MVVKNTAVNVVFSVFFSLGCIGNIQAAVSYAPPSPTAAGTGPEFVAKGQLNGDTNMDIVSVNADGGTVSVLLSDGTGGFTKVNYAVGVQPRTAAIGDLDGDGDNDLVVTNTDTPGTGSITVLLNDGLGAFTAGSPIDIEALAGAGAEPSAAVIAQLNGTTDSNPDIAIGNDITNNVQILLGNGDGTFTAGGTIAVGNKPISIASGSIDTATDALTDIVVGNLDDGTVNVLLGDGVGGFSNATGSPVSTGGKTFAVQIASVDSLTDSVPDIALVTHTSTSSDVRVFKGVGDGTFASTPMLNSSALAGRPHSVEVADLDSNGTPDLLVASDNTGTTPVAAVTVLLGDGNGAFPTVAQYPVSGAPNSVVSADLDGINQVDVVIANGNTDSVDVLLSVPTGLAPTANDGTLSVTEDTATNGTLTGTDPEGALLAYSIVSNGAKGTAVITDAAAGTYVYTPNSDVNGADTFTFKVNDGAADSNPVATINVTISAVNDAPTRTAGTVNNLTVLEDSGLTSLGLGALAYGPGGGSDEASQTLSYAVTAVPAASLGDVVLADGTTVVSVGSYSLAQIQGMQFRSAPDASGGPATFSFTVQDTGGTLNGGVDTLTESLAINVTAVNDAPVRTAGTVNNLSVQEDSGLTSLGLGALAYGPGGGGDEAGQALSYAVTAVPAASLGDVVLADGTTVVSAGSYSLAQIQGMQFRTVSNANGGPATFSFTVQDDGGVTNGGVDTLTESLTISVTAVNDPPTISGTPLTSVSQGAAYSFTPGANDPDVGDTLTFSITNQPTWASFDTATGALTGTPANGDVGTTTGIVISVTDSNSAPVPLPAFDLTVVNVNDPPTISGTPVTSVNQDAAYSFTPTANDVDVGDTLTFSITNQPTWASFDTATGALTGTPANADVGTTTGIVISVTDSNSAPVALPAFDLTVVNVNDAPTISGTPATTVVQDTAYSFTPTAGDVDVGDTLTFSITNQPTWASFDTATGALTGTPTSTDVGTTAGIVIAVTDSNSAPVSLSAFDLTVELDSNGDGLSDAQSAAIGLDPQLTDTDNDGNSDASEVGGDPANPTDSDSDGVIDALEFAPADPNTLEFLVPAPTASALALPDLSLQQVTLSGNGAAVTANNNGMTGLPLYAESDLAVDDASFTYPFGVYDFNVVAPGGTATVTLTLPAGITIPADAVVRKLNVSNQWQTLAGAVIDRTNRTVTLTLADNDGVFDLDNTAGLIRDPVGVAVPVPVSSGGGGGGGCSLGSVPRRGEFDPVLPLLILAPLLYLRRRRRQKAA